MKYKAIFCDVDGTLVPPTRFIAPRPTGKVIEKVKEAREKGVIFSLSTARSLDSVGELIESLELQDPIILDNGAVIYDCRTKKYLRQSFIPKKEAEIVLKILKNYKAEKMVIMDNFTRIYDPSKIKEWKISKIVLVGISPETSEEIYRKIRKINSVQAAKSVSGTDDINESIHVTNQDATKGSALRKIMRLKGLKKEEIIGIGDSYNDYSLLLESGLKVAVKNAVPEIIKIADYIAPSYEEDGIAELIEKFILNK